MKLKEILDRKVEYEVINSNNNTFTTKAIIGDRKIIFDCVKEDDIWEAVFFETNIVQQKFSTMTTKFDKTGSGNELEVFSMVKDSLIEFIKKYQPEKITFNAYKSNGDESRAKLYKKLIKKFKVPGYRYEIEETKYKDNFWLIKES